MHASALSSRIRPCSDLRKSQPVRSSRIRPGPVTGPVRRLGLSFTLGDTRMSWSWKLCRVAGIPIYVHWTFVILLAWIVFGYWFESHDLLRTLEGVGLILTIFA